MKPTRKAVMALAVLICVVLVPTGGFGSDETSVARRWTLMFYFNGDDPVLEGDFINAFEKMADARVGSDTNINVVIQFDRIPGHDTRYGDWVICHRFFLSPGLLPTEDAAIKDWGDGAGGREVRMDQGETLRDFIRWSATNYPAERYVLVVASHGFGWKGMSIDATSDENYMFLPELAQALVDARVDIDLIGLDACNMQTIEAAYELMECDVGIMVGSQNPGGTWPFWDILKGLSAVPTATPEELARAMVDLYYDWQSTYDKATLAVADLRAIGPFTQRIEELAVACMDGSSTEAIQARAQAVLNRFDEAVLYSRSRGKWATIAHGLSLYFPEKTGDYRPEFFSYYYIGKMTAFAEDVGWRDLLNAFYDPLGGIAAVVHAVRPTLGLLADTESIDLYQFCKAIVDHDP